MSASQNNKPGNLLSRPNVRFAMYGALAIAVVAFSFVRVLGNLPDIMGDELVYSMAARHLPMSQAAIPDYLYYWVYSTTNVCGIGFYSCSQALNVSFSLAAGLLLFAVGKRFAPNWAAALVALFFVLGPMAAYNSYFMPESMYFFFFVLLIWYMTLPSFGTNIPSWAISGLLLGLLALVKPHGLLLAPAVASFALFLAWKTQGKWLLRALVNATTFGITALATKLLLGLMFAGPNGFTLFGGYSGSAATALSGTPGNPQSPFLTNAPKTTSFAFISEQIWVQLLAAAFISALPLVVTVLSALEKKNKVGLDSEINVSHYSTLIMLILGWMIPAIAIFANVTRLGGEDTSNRIMVRYYEFLFPLLLVSLASHLKARDSEFSTWKRWVGLAISAGLAITAFVLIPGNYNLQFVDSAFLKVILGTQSADSSGQMVHWFGMLFLVFSFIALVVWAAKPHWGSVLWIAACMPIVLIIGAVVINGNPTWRSTSTLAADTAGMFVRDSIPQSELKNLVIVGAASGNKAELVAKFHIDNPAVSTATVLDGRAYSAPVGSHKIRWELALGDVKLTDPGYVVARVAGVQLLRRDLGDVTIFNNDYVGGIVKTVQGLDRSSGQGMCASRSQVVITFNKPLPSQASIRMGTVGSPLNPNQQMEVVIGDWNRVISVPAPHRPIDVSLDAENSVPVNKLTINLPASDTTSMCLSYIEIVH